MPDFTKEQLDAKPFWSTDAVILTKDEWLAKMQSVDRIVATARLELEKKPLLLWAFYSGHTGKIWKCVIDGDPVAHKTFHGRLTYHKTSTEAQAEFDKLLGELVKAGAVEPKEVVADG
jgi:hypothetical protein